MFSDFDFLNVFTFAAACSLKVLDDGALKCWTELINFLQLWRAFNA